MAGLCKFREDSNAVRNKGFTLGFTPTQILWDGDKIYIASKRAYMVLSYQTGDLLFKHEIDVRDVPMMTVLQDKFLVVTRGGRCAQFISQGRMLDHPMFNLETNSALVSIHLVAEYVIAVFETFVRIFKSQSGDCLQEAGRLDTRNTIKFRYKAANVNPIENEVALMALNVKEAKNTVQTEVYTL